jgi:hypothetical protein
MGKLLLSAVACFVTANALWAQVDMPMVPIQTIGEGKLIKVTGDVKTFVKDPSFKDVPVRDENGRIITDGRKPVSPVPPGYETNTQLIISDPAQQPEMVFPLTEVAQASVGTNFNGMGFSNVNPPDPTVAVGPNHVIQMINGSSGAFFRIYSKSGTPLSNQIYLDNLTGRGGLGDPIVLYDHLADRFVMTEFANRGETGSEGLVMAVSQTSDPLGSWFVYYFSTGTTFPDYPKFSVWPDGYYATSNDFASSYNGSTIYAFDRSRMLNGQSVTGFQSFKFSTTSYTKYFAMCPVLLQGNTLPPAGTGGLIAYMFEDSWTSTTADRDSIGLIEYRVNWSNPSQSTINNISSLATAAFKSQICTASRGACIPQPGTTTQLEALHMRVMNQPIYRNFSGNEGIVMSFAVDVGSSRAGIRWYEMRKSGTNPWGIHQESTWTLSDAIHRWMSSIAYDGEGNIALAYNVSASSNTFPGIRFTGRRACDPLNVMTTAETVIVNGTSRNGSSRYGDYNHLIADPNGQSFWFTGQWNSATSWSTRVANFSLASCQPVVCDAPVGLGSSNIGSSTATVSWSAVGSASNYTVEYKTTAATNWTTAASATTATSLNLTGLTASTTYDWRVRTNCGTQSSDFVQAQFVTTAPAPCNPPTGLSSSNISSTGATVSWAAVSGAVSYRVEYKTTAATSWTTAATSTTATSINLSNLTASTTYDWRVRTNCTDNQSEFVQAQFSTIAPPPCDPPTGLSSSNISNTGATVSWTAVSGAVSYRVEYKTTAATSWTTAATSTTSTSIGLSGLTGSTTYDWRVQTNCTDEQSNFAQAQFTTADNPIICTDPYEPNDVSTQAAAITPGFGIEALICAANDRDWYTFNNNNQNKNVRVTLTIPSGVNYNMRLIRPNGQVAGTTSGTSSVKTLTYSGNPTGAYRVEVYSSSGFSTTNSYALLAEISNSSFTRNNSEMGNGPELTTKMTDGFYAYPNPARELINIAYEAEKAGVAEIRLIDQQGRASVSQLMQVVPGLNMTTVPVSKLASGLYIIRVQQDNRVITQKVMIMPQ